MHQPFTDALNNEISKNEHLISQSNDPNEVISFAIACERTFSSNEERKKEDHLMISHR